MFVLAHSAKDQRHVFYFDVHGNKYVARGGNLVWRINNPGLVRSRSRVAKQHESIGACGQFAIFPSAGKGHEALTAWLRQKRNARGTLKTLAKHYQPGATEAYASQLASLTELPVDAKIGALSESKTYRLLRGLEQLCGFTLTGTEELVILPKITGKIYNGKNTKSTYLIGTDLVLSKEEVIRQIQSHQIDASVVHEANGRIHIRSRPHHSIMRINSHLGLVSITKTVLGPEEPIVTFMRIVGKYTPGQCIWGFINGISNSKKNALASAELISQATGGEAVWSLQNDTSFLGIVDVETCGFLKSGTDLPITTLAAQFFRYLLALSEQNDGTPVVVFAHSQGAIITEHALQQLADSERLNLRIFTFGGGSLIAPGQSHIDSHNYVCRVDPVCFLGSPRLYMLALHRHTWQREGVDSNMILEKWAIDDALLAVNKLEPEALDAYRRERVEAYRAEMNMVSNVTMVEPDPGISWQHSFNSNCYQTILRERVKQYREHSHDHGS